MKKVFSIALIAFLMLIGSTTMQAQEEELAEEGSDAVAEERNFFVFKHRLADVGIRTANAY